MKYKTTSETGTIAAAVLLLSITAAALYGYGSNLITLIHQAQANAPVGAMLILRGIGLFVPPLGVVLGYF